MALALSLAGCASQAERSCSELAGNGWGRTSTPANATALLALDGIQQGGDMIWLRNGDDQLMACRYGGPMVTPGCSNSHGYAFKRSAGMWRTNGEFLAACGE